MKSSKIFLPVSFTVIMLLFILFVFWYIPTDASLNFQLQDVGKSLETSQGRERKQKKEYNEAAKAIPETEAEIARILPLAEAAQQEVTELKTQRRKLRDEKKALEAQLEAHDQEVIKND